MDTPWQKQLYSKPLFDDILWSRPEQKALAGKLLIVGGNAHAIAAPGEAYAIAMRQGVGEAKVIMPDKTRKLLGPKIPLDIELVPSTPSGSFSTRAEQALNSYISWGDATLFAGDIGRNSETAILFESIAKKMPGMMIYTQDAADYFYSFPQTLFDRFDTLLVISIAQLQKFCRQLHWPKAVTLEMGIGQLCELLQALTTTYKTYLVVEYAGNMITAVDGHVIVTKLPKEPQRWRLKTATTASVWWLQNPSEPLKAIATAITQINW